MRWGALFAVGLLVLCSALLAESSYDKWKTPENKGASQKNVIDPGSLVNPNTGEFTLRYPLPAFVGRGFSFTPSLSYTPTVSKTSSTVFQRYFREDANPVSVENKLPYSAFGYGWSMAPFGSISVQRRAHGDNTVYFEYRMVLPGGGSEKLLEYGTEVPAAGDSSVPAWNADPSGDQVYVQVFHIETNPYFVIKRYRTEKGQITGLAVPNTAISDNVRWFVQSPSNDKYYFDHGVYSRVPVTIKGATGAWQMPKTVSVYFKEYSRWDLTKLVPHNIEANAVQFAYEDQYSYVHKVREQYQQILNTCKAAIPSCGSNVDYYLGLDSIPWNSVGRTDYISTSYPKRIFQPNVGTGSPSLEFYSYVRDAPVFDTNFATDGSGNGPLDVYCKRTAGFNYCSKSSTAVYGTDGGGTPFMQLYGTPDNPWGGYVTLSGLAPYTTYVIKGSFDADTPGWAPSGCTEGDIELSQYPNADSTPNHGFYSLVKVGTVPVGGAYAFDPEYVFAKSVAFSAEGKDAAWFAASDWDSGMQCWQQGGSCSSPDAGVKSDLDSYMVNCFTAGHPIEVEESFTTGAETSRVLYIAAYNPKLADAQKVTLKMRRLGVEKRPSTKLVTGIDYAGHEGDRKVSASYNLDYDSDADGDGTPSLVKVTQVGFLAGLPGLGDSLPSTQFVYDTGAQAGKLIKKVMLPTGGYVELGSSSVRTQTITEPDPWLPYYVGDWYPSGYTGSNTHTKYQLVAGSINVNDGYRTLTTNYDYASAPSSRWTWSPDRETDYIDWAEATNPLGDKVKTQFHVGAANYPAGPAGPLFGLTKAVTSTDHAYGLLSNTANEYGTYEFRETAPHIFHVRSTKSTSTSYGTGEFSTQFKTSESTDDAFDTANCDAVTGSTNRGFSDVTGDESVTNNAYTSVGDFKCLLASSEQKGSGEANPRTRTLSEYYTAADAKQGLLKKVTQQVLGRTAENSFTTLDYDSYSNIRTITDSLGAVTTIDYDTSHNMHPVKHTAPLSLVEEMYYDEFERPNRVKGVNNEESFVQYDDLNRICKYQLPGGSTPTLVGSETVASICSTQPLHTPALREGIPTPVPALPGIGQTCTASRECAAGAWCCDVPNGHKTCVSTSESCPPTSTCVPACDSTHGCCDDAEDGVGYCTLLTDGCSVV